LEMRVILESDMPYGTINMSYCSSCWYARK
ncbi:MAG: CRISPR/Cas system-associated exonuclease Cas4 (RecB family), partial [Lentimonas sp.]